MAHDFDGLNWIVNAGYFYCYYDYYYYYCDDAVNDANWIDDSEVV